tara:strand:- start:667 stop:1041 length:375 start_codon:yes stop_codon:yes gene_type:complete
MGKGAKDSYCAAYNAKGMSDQSISKEAKKLDKHPQIAPQIISKKEEATERALVTVQDVVKGLLLEAQTNGEGSTQGARVSAWKHLGEFTGSFDANKQKVEHSGEIDINNLTDDQIQARIAALSE